jgi:YD repeat-containing protein
MNTPCLHFEINEAWILDPDAGILPESAVTNLSIQVVEERHPGGALRSRRGFARSDSGAPVLHGAQAFHYPDGTPEYSSAFDRGRQVGQERHWRPDGTPVWVKLHGPDGHVRFTRYDEAGRKRSQTDWNGHLAHGPAHTWDARGNLVATVFFDHGRLVTEDPDA